MRMVIWELSVVNEAFSVMEFFLQLLLNGVSTGFLYGISAIGLILIFRSGGLLNFAHGGMMAFGAFLFFTLSVQANWPIIVSFVVTLTSSFALGLILEKCFMRPVFLKENLIHKILITLGLALMLKGLLSFFFGEGVYHLPKLVSETLSISWHNLQMKSFHISAFAAGAVLLILYWFFFTFSSTGLSMRAFAENPLAARTVGVPAKRVSALSWAIAALLCALCGVLLSTVNGLHSDSLSAAGLKVFPVIILGGLNNIKSAIWGGIIVGLLETFSGGYIDPSLQDIAPYFALLLILVLKPSNFFVRTELEKG